MRSYIFFGLLLVVLTNPLGIPSQEDSCENNLIVFAMHENGRLFGISGGRHLFWDNIGDIRVEFTHNQHLFSYENRQSIQFPDETQENLSLFSLGHLFTTQSPREPNGQYRYKLLDVETLAIEDLPHGDLIDTMPQWSSDGSRITFASWRRETGFDLYVMNRDGSNLKHMASGQTIGPDPLWSPDDNWIAFNAERQIFAAQIAEDWVIQLTSGDLYNYLISWSSDGTAILFATLDPGVSLSLSMLDFETLSIKPLTKPQNQIFDYFVSWTPEGNILFNSNRISSRLTLHLLDPFNGTITQYMEHFVAGLSWTSDKSAFVFMSNQEIEHPNRALQNIFITDWSTGSTTQITKDWTIYHGNYLRPALSPDDSRIVFETFVDGDYELFIMDIDGGNLRQLTFNNYHDIDPKWVPCQTG